MKLHVGKSNRKDGQSTTTYSITERKTSIYFFSMSDEESRSVHKRMWKITSGVFIVFFSAKIALKGHVINNLLTSSVRSLQGNLGPRP